MDSILASRQPELGSVLDVPNFFSMQEKFLMLPKFIDIALLRVWAVQSLIVDQTHLVLGSGKLVLQKTIGFHLAVLSVS